MARDPLAPFTDRVAGWFRSTFAEPTPAQAKGWPAISSGDHTLILAPTGSGKTLAAFLWALDRLCADGERGRTRVLYVSPLRALNHDVERNLRAPLAGIGADPPVAVALRSGDTPQSQRAAIRRNPPDILITTPESLYLMLTSGAREVLSSVETVIIDEIHAVAGTKRGSHLMLSLERLSAITATEPQRIGLSATQRPLEEISRFLGGDRPVTIVDAGHRKPLDLEVVIPVEDMRELGAAPTVEGEPRQSIWPAIYPRLLELVQAHRSTIVFVNNRRSAERVANRLNELAEAPVARSHHGSIAREQRLEVEELLKSGQLPALVATSSLELGIDMGAVDLVVQIESPKSVAAGLQRVGRAGHGVGEASVGRFFPKWRGDLLETAVVVRRMREGEIEHTRVPKQPLDVLAQQVVATLAMDEWPVDALHDLVRRAYPYRELSRAQFEGVLEMLAGRYPSDEFAELRPRIVWDRIAGTVRARDGARRLAVVSGGTIPDRGLYGVFLADSGARVGELDEEMVYEARQGEVFQLGATSWRIEQITRDRVLVSPAPGVPGKMPFWKGDGIGRPFELGIAVGEAVRKRRFGDLDELAARNLAAYLDDQREATGVVPDDRTIVVERFRDEIGDWRICILSPFGGRVHAPWAMAIEARMGAAAGIEVEAMWSDDGIALRLPDADEPPPLELIAIAPEDLDDLLVERVASSPLFAGRFRENAARALLIPRRRPGQRTPLWQQRLKAHDLQQVAVKHGSFPIVLETYRELLADVFEVPALRGLLQRIGRGEVRLIEVESERPSPFASSLLFDYIATYMYEGDAPVAERRAQALQLDRALLSELLSAGDLRELLDAEAISEVESELGGGARRRTADDDHDRLRRLGDMAPADVPHGEQLVRERRAVAVRIAGRERMIAAEDAALYRDAIGTAIPPGLPAAFLDPVDDPLERLAARHARTHGPFTADELRGRLGVDPLPALEALAERGELLRGAFRPGGASEEWVAPDVLRRVRRRTLAAPAPRGGAGRPRRAGAVPAHLARHRPRPGPRAGPRARGDLAAGRRGVARTGMGAGHPAGARARVPAVRPRCAVRRRRGGVGGRRPRPRRAGAARGCAVPAQPSGGPRAPGAGRAAPVGRAVLPRPAGRAGRHRARAARRRLGAGLGRPRDQRQLAAAARRRAAAGRAPAAGPPPGAADRAAPGGAGPLVAGRPAARAGADAARPRPSAGRGAARPPRRAHPAGCAGRGHPRRLLVGLRRAAADGGGWSVPARVLRRGPGRRPVRAAGRGRAAARRAVGRLRRRDGGALRGRPGEPAGHRRPLAGGAPQAGARGRRPRRAGRRRARAVRRARRAQHRGARPRAAGAGDRGADRPGRRRPRPPARDREGGRRADRRHARGTAADGARLPAGAAAGRAACLRVRASCWPRAGWRRSSATR